MSDEIIEISDGFVTALDVSPINTYAKTIKSYAGEYQQDAGKVLVILPAVLVLFAGDNYEVSSANNRVYKQTTNWDVLVASRNLRGDAARREGAASEVGIFEMLYDIRGKLVANRLGLDIEPLRIIRRWPILIDPRAYIWGLRFQTWRDYEQT